MAHSGSCPTCGQEFTTDQVSGSLDCTACLDSIWFARFGSELITASSQQLETQFGFYAGELTGDETVELLRDWHHDAVDEPWHNWNATDISATDQHDPTGWESNPYHPPRSPPQRTDPVSETFVFRAGVPCDRQTLQWSTRTFGVQSDVAGLAFFGFLLVLALVAVLLEGYLQPIWSVIRPGLTGWIVIGVILLFIWRWIPGFVMAPYIRLLDRRCEADPLYAGDQYWIMLRSSTMTARSETAVFTWPLREVRGVHNDDHLVIYRVARRRLLYLTSSSETVPEDFALFRRGIKKRLRRYWRAHFLHIEIY